MILGDDEEIFGVVDKLDTSLFERKEEVFEEELKKHDYNPDKVIFVGDTESGIADLLPYNNFVVPPFATDEFKKSMKNKQAFVPNDTHAFLEYLQYMAQLAD